MPWRPLRGSSLRGLFPPKPFPFGEHPELRKRVLHKVSSRSSVLPLCYTRDVWPSISFWSFIEDGKKRIYGTIKFPLRHIPFARGLPWPHVSLPWLWDYLIQLDGTVGLLLYLLDVTNLGNIKENPLVPEATMRLFINGSFSIFPSI